MPLHEYDDAYATCRETSATLRIYSDDLQPDKITAAMGFEPTQSFLKAKPGERPPYKMHGWFYSTEGLCDSRDCRRHLDLLLAGPLKNVDALNALRRAGCQMDVSVYYVYTQGGPTISPAQARGLAEAGIDLWWDLYRANDDELESSVGPGGA